MIETVTKKPTWTRRLSIERGLRKQDRSETIPSDISILTYKTLLSLGTETRVLLLCNGEPLIEIHEDERGYINVEVQGIEASGVRVKLTALPNQTIEGEDNSFTID